MAARHCRAWVVAGRVQGVGFRYFVVAQARRHGLAGWVRNREDGTVEIHASGEGPALESLEAALWAGPPHAEVSAVTSVLASEALEDRDDFTIEYVLA